ncbi:helix-turn-helix domain-containing protein [Bacillus sp. sid0103]|uniref:helix-turn-helix domain-containing protein n=1 Tax=Bacillus sp. sid0103 TaxID=2856337 RepID=UPI001C45AA46|nr:helix-turn-helix domain-containing protein [Bacillus sp. sid0103]MBV7506925.1 helix-turn-helix domain-containing protein [Bacillus sp. sid0103]
MTNESTVDVILHPVRMRIIQYLINQQLTAQQLKEFLPDIPQASLYRNLKKLVETKVIHIVGEIPNRGTIEKVYSIQNPNKVSIGPEDLNKLSRDEHMSLFIKFMANLMGEYDRYLDQDSIDLVADGVTFRQASIYLSEEEYTEFVKELAAVYLKVTNNEPKKGRRRRTVATIMIPEKMKEK